MPSAPAGLAAPASRLCIKCRSVPAAFARGNAAYCLDCFLAAISRRFRDVMQPAKVHCRGAKFGDPSASALLAFSGSSSSKVTLDMLHQFHWPRPTKGPKDTFTTFRHIEVVYVASGSAEEEARIDDMKTFLASYEVELTVLPASDVYAASSTSVSLDSRELEAGPSSISNGPAGIMSEHPAFTPASSQTLTTATLTAHLAQYAQQNGHKAVIMCDTATKLAAKTLSAMSKGQGWNLGELVSASDVPIHGSHVRIYRPLSNVSSGEVNFYATAAKDWPASISSPNRAGIDGLLENFVDNLEVGFPSTVSIIGRTAGKLGMRSSDTEAAKVRCPVCRQPADQDARKWREAASLSSLIEEPATTSPRTNGTAEDDSHTDSAPAPTPAPLADLLCYGCLVPFLELQAAKKPGEAADQPQQVLTLPTYSQEIIAERQKLMGRKELKKEIQEFLLEDDPDQET